MCVFVTGSCITAHCSPGARTSHKWLTGTPKRMGALALTLSSGARICCLLPSSCPLVWRWLTGLHVYFEFGWINLHAALRCKVTQDCTLAMVTNGNLQGGGPERTMCMHMLSNRHHDSHTSPEFKPPSTSLANDQGVITKALGANRVG